VDEAWRGLVKPITVATEVATVPNHHFLFSYFPVAAGPVVLLPVLAPALPWPEGFAVVPLSDFM
jgi:hypothetical protein